MLEHIGPLLVDTLTGNAAVPIDSFFALFLLWSGATTSIFTVSVQSYTVLSNDMLAPKLDIAIANSTSYETVSLDDGATDCSPALPASL